MSLQVWIPGTKDFSDQGLSGEKWKNSNVTINSSGKLGSCLSFAGNADLLNDSSIFKNSVWSISSWLYTTTISNNQCFVCTRKSLGAGVAIFFLTGSLRVDCGSIDTSGQKIFNYTIPVNTWTHICVVHEESRVVVYINGQEIGTHNHVTDVNSYSSYTTIGTSQVNGSSYGNNWNGKMNDIRIYDHALSPREVKEISKGLVLHYPLSGPAPEQLFGEVTEDNAIYSIRQSPDKHAAYDSIVGASVGWNQLVQNGDFSSGLTNWVSGGASTNTVSNNTATITVNNANAYDAFMYQNIDLISGHKYFISLSYYVNTSYTGSGVFCVALLHPTTAVGRTSIYNKHDNFAGVFNVTAQNAIAIGKIGSRNTLSVGDTITLKNVMLVDLTALFNQTIANYIYNLGSSSATWLRSHGFFTQDYYQYNPGQIKNVEGLAKRETVGNNLIDLASYMNTLQISKTENYYVDTAAHYSQKSAATPFPIKYIPNTQYCVTATGHKSGTLTAFYFIFYYTDGTRETASLISSETDSTVYGISTAGKTVSKIVFSYGSNGNNNFYLKDLCVNISDSNFNGTYEPYVSHSYSYTNSPVLRGIYKLDSNNNIYADGDIWDSNGNIKRNYAVMVLDGTNRKFSGSFGLQDSGNYVVYRTMPVDKTSYTICDRFEYSTYGISTMPLYSYVGSSGANTTWSFALPNTITSLNEANAWLVNNPVTIIYKLAVPTTETSTKFTNPQIIEPYGTELYSHTGVIPPGHITKYVDIEIEGGNYTYDESLTNMGMTDNIEYDVSGYRNNGTKVGSITYDADTPRYETSAVFSGNQHIVEPNEIITTDSTIALWVKSSLNGNGFVLDARNNSGIGKQPIYQYTDGHIQTGGNTKYVTSNSGLLVANTWVHVVLVQNGNSLLIYKNGDLFQTISCENSPVIKPTLGARYTFSGGYTGQLSDLRIYATALSPQDVRDLYAVAASISDNGTLMASEVSEV